MWIVTQNESQILNGDYIERYCLVEKPDCTLIIASYSSNREPITLGRYTKKEVHDVFESLLRNSACENEEIYRFPVSEVVAGEHIVKDARVARKGGS